MLETALGATIGGVAAVAGSVRLVPDRVADYHIVLIQRGDPPPGERVQSLRLTVSAISRRSVNLPIAE